MLTTGMLVVGIALMALGWWMHSSAMLTHVSSVSVFWCFAAGLALTSIGAARAIFVWVI